MERIYIVALSALVFGFFGCQQNQSKEPKKVNKEMAVDSIAARYGVDQFYKIDSVKFTFAVSSSRGQSARRWYWNPHYDVVRYQGDDTRFTYQRDAVAQDSSLKPRDARFVNDKYWLFFPFQINWDPANHILNDSATAPLSGKKMSSLKIIYPDTSGYTPGDSYTVYFDSTFTIREWTYCPRNDCANGRSYSWSKQQFFGPFAFTTLFQGENNKVSIQMKDLQVYFE